MGDEYKQFIMENEFNGGKNLRFLIGDVRDYERVERAMNNDIESVVFTSSDKAINPANSYGY